MSDYTWGDLRTLNTKRLSEEMVKIGKGNRISFRMTVGSSTEWLIIPGEMATELERLKKENSELKQRIEAIKTIAGIGS